MISRLPVPILITAVLGLAVPGLRGDDDLAVKNIRVDVTDLAEVSGLDVYKWQIHVHKGQKLRVVLDVQAADGAEPRNCITRVVTASKDGDAALLASFLREDRKLASVFLSDGGKMEFRLNWEGAVSDGLTGIIANPLGEVPLGQKALQIHNAPKQSDGGYELLLLFRTEPSPRGLQVFYPQATLRIEPAK